MAGFGLGDKIDNVIGGVFDFMSGEQETERRRIESQTQQNTNTNIEKQLSEASKMNKYLTYGAFGLLFFGVLLALREMTD